MMVNNSISIMIEGSLEVKLPTIWTDEKQSREEAERRERSEGKKMEMREKVGKSRNTVFFPMICGSGGSKSRLAKAAGAEPAGQISDEKLHADVARSRFPSQNVQNTPVSDHFWKLRCQKVHAVVARSTFASQNVENTSAPDHFWKLRCRKSARRCGAKPISKSKCTKHTIVGPLLEVQMSKKCTPLWREAHFQVKMYKTHQVRTTFGSSDVEKVHAVVARSTFPSQNVQNTTCSRHFWRFGCRTSARRCLNVTSDVRQTCEIAYSSDVDLRFHFCNTILLFLFDCVSFLTAILPGLCIFSDRNPAMEYTEKLPVEIDPEMWFTRGWNWQKCTDR